MRHLHFVIAVTGVVCSTAAAQTFWALPNSGDWVIPGNWSPADVPDSLAESAVIDAAGTYTVTLNLSATIRALAISEPNVTLAIPATRTLGLSAVSHTNNGLITLNLSSSSANAVLVFVPDNFVPGPVTQTISGAGAILLGGDTNDSQLNTGLAVTLVNGATHMIAGGGELNARLVNEGLVRATNTGFASILELQAEDKINNGRIESSPGATLRIEGVTIDQTGGGTIDAVDGTVLFGLSTSSTVLGGTLDNSAGGLLQRASGGVTTLDSVTIQGPFQIDAGGTVAITGTGLTNNATISVNNSGSSGDGVIRFDETATIDGAGAILLGGGSDDSRLDSADGVTGTIGASQTVQGAGQINASLVNNGIVRATSTGFSSVLELQTGDKVNNGRFESSPNAALQIESVTIDQSGGGVIDAVDGTVLFGVSTSSTVLGGTLDNSAGGLLHRASGGVTTLDSVTIQGPFQIDAGGTVAITGTGLTNNATISVNNSGSSGDGVIRFDETATIGGAGAILLGGGSDDSRLDSAGGATGTIGASQTVQGAGQINASLVNNGIVRATNTGFSSVLELQTGDKVNNGRFESSSNAALQIESVTIDQSGGGVIDAVDGTVLFGLSTNSTVLGGTLDNSAGGLLHRASGGVTTLDSVTIQGPFQIDAGGTVAITGTGLTNNATISVNNSGSSGDGVIRFDETATIDGAGAILLGGGSNDSRLDSADGVTGTIGASQTVQGAGEVNASLVNNGVVRATSTGFGSVLEIQGGSKVNNTRFESSPGATLQIGSVTIDQTGGGTIDAVDGTVLFGVSTSSTVLGGTLDNSSGGLLQRAGGGVTTLGAVTVEGDLDVAPVGTIAVVAPGITNNATIILNDTGSSGDGVLRFEETATIGGAGTILLGGGSDDSQLNAAAGVTGTIGAAQIVVGSGEMNGDFILHGALDLGLPSVIGSIVLSGSLDLGATSLVRADLISPVSHDQLARTAGSAVTLDGELEATVDAAYSPTLGDEFDVVGPTGPVSGEFGAVTVVGLSPLYQLRQVVLADRMLLRVANPTCAPDYEEPRGVLDFSDVLAFLSYFGSADPFADLAPPEGVFDFSDVFRFLIDFGAGCP